MNLQLQIKQDHHPPTEIRVQLHTYIVYILKNWSLRVSSKFAVLRTMVLAKFAAFKLGKSCSGVPPPPPHAAAGFATARRGGVRRCHFARRQHFSKQATFVAAAAGLLVKKAWLAIFGKPHAVTTYCLAVNSRRRVMLRTHALRHCHTPFCTSASAVRRATAAGSPRVCKFA